MHPSVEAPERGELGLPFLNLAMNSQNAINSQSLSRIKDVEKEEKFSRRVMKPEAVQAAANPSRPQPHFVHDDTAQSFEHREALLWLATFNLRFKAFILNPFIMELEMTLLEILSAF